MKKLFAIFAVGLLVWSCGGNSEKRVKTFSDVEQEFASTLTEADTAKVLAMGNQFLDSIRSGNVAWSLDQLNEIDSVGAIVPISTSTRERLEARFRNFPVVDYELDYYAFSLSGLNDLKYRTFFQPSESREAGAPGMSMMFNPVKKDGEWYPCLKEAGQPAKDASSAIDPRTIVE